MKKKEENIELFAGFVDDDSYQAVAKYFSQQGRLHEPDQNPPTTMCWDGVGRHLISIDEDDLPKLKSLTTDQGKRVKFMTLCREDRGPVKLWKPKPKRAKRPEPKVSTVTQLLAKLQRSERPAAAH